MGFVRCPLQTYHGQKGKGGSSDSDIQTFRYKKIQIFPKLWCICTDGVDAVRTFFGQGEEVNFFAILCGRSLGTKCIG